MNINRHNYEDILIKIKMTPLVAIDYFDNTIIISHSSINNIDKTECYLWNMARNQNLIPN